MPRLHLMAGLAMLLLTSAATAAPLEAPPGLAKDLNDEIAGDAMILRGKQLFIDDYIVDQLDGAAQVLNQPVKHPGNPVLVRDKPWEESPPGYGTVLLDRETGMFTMWYQIWPKTEGTSTGLLCLATSRDGIQWDKPITNEETGTNIVFHPPIQGFQAPGIFKDAGESDPAKRYKMLFSANPDGTDKTWMTSAAWSPDGIHWQAAPEIPLIPFSDTQSCPFWDPARRRYVATLRFGPPNTRIVSRIESEDFVHWSPKTTVLARTRLDEPLATQFYLMTPIPYEGVYLGLICAYYNESLKPPAADEPWTDRKNLQLAFSRNGVTWSRVGRQGAFSSAELKEDRDWKQETLDAAFVPYGQRDRDWDWGTLHPYFTPEPIIVGDEIWFYYIGQNARNWWTYAGDPPTFQPDATVPDGGVGLATLRLDGFVSIDAAEGEGVLTTRPLVFMGDTLEVNANAEGGQITVEALDADGSVIEGFSRQDCTPITTDSVRHAVEWKGSADCYLLQARPIRLRFHLQAAKLYAFEARVRHNHYVPSYD